MNIEEIRSYACCFTGHRIIKQEHQNKLPNIILGTVIDLYHKGFTHFITGGAIGFDMLAANSVLYAKSEYEDIKLILAIPCKDHNKRWIIQHKQEFNKIMSLADNVIYVSTQYFNGCMHKRNRFMVDHSSICISYQYKNSGGTYYTVNYAKQQNIKVINLLELT